LSYTAKKVCECGNIDEFSDWDHSGGSFITIYCQLLKENDYSIENALNILLKDEILCDDKFDCNLCKPKTGETMKHLYTKHFILPNLLVCASIIIFAIFYISIY
jgi:hypothetical protein